MVHSNMQSPITKLILGDTTRADVLPTDSVDLIITSPPYNVGIDYGENIDVLPYEDYLDFTRTWLSNSLAWAKSGGRACVNVAVDTGKWGEQRPLAADLTAIAQEVGWCYHATIVWHKTSVSNRTAWGSWQSASAPYVMPPYEVILVFCKGDWKREDKGVDDITRDEFLDWTLGLWTLPPESATKVNHPAPFPRQLVRRLIKLFSFKDDLILDPFVGSGTTIIESLDQHRRSVGIELNPEFIELSTNRIFDEVGVVMSMQSDQSLMSNDYPLKLDL